MAQRVPFGGDISDDLDPAVGHLLHVAVELFEESVLNGAPFDGMLHIGKLDQDNEAVLQLG